MLASFSNMDGESQNRDNGNASRFNPLEKHSNHYLIKDARVEQGGDVSPGAEVIDRQSFKTTERVLFLAMVRKRK